MAHALSLHWGGATQRNLVLKNCGGRDGMGRWDADDIPQDEDMAQGLGP